MADLPRRPRLGDRRPAGADPAERPVGIVHVNGSLTLSQDLSPGTYTLQVSVGPRPGRRDRHATQWVDFEVR